MHIVRMAEHAASALDLFDRGFMDEAWVEVRAARERTNALMKMNREAKAGDR
jgi:hypothetical protein